MVVLEGPLVEVKETSDKSTEIIYKHYLSCKIFMAGCVEVAVKVLVVETL